jgi:hypothetical protein
MRTLAKVAGFIAFGSMVLLVTAWSYWSANEMYHEGWWGAWWHPLPYLAPTVITLIPTLIAIRWPIVGGILLVGVGTFASLFFSNDVRFIGLAIGLVGVAFAVDGMVKRRSQSSSEEAAPRWRRHWRTLLAVGAPLVVVLTVSAYTLPRVLARVDDHDRGARRIEGNGIALTWAPEGPGWNARQSWGGYPSWQSIALYGVAPVGLGDKPGYGPQGRFASSDDMQRTNLCLYLNADGTIMHDVPQYVWRMPTTEEVVRSLGRNGDNAACTWNGKLGFVQCAVRPDKESPLWATDHPVIYYWTADSHNDTRGYFVSFNGAVNVSYKPGGNPRHSYRCVKP